MKASCLDRSGFFKGLTIAIVLAAAPVMTLVLASPPAPAPEPGDIKYIGAEQCKNCHSADKAGNQYAKWKDMKHAKTYEVLAGDEAKKIAKEKGIDDPQKSEKCLKCHVTAFGKPPEILGKKFDPKQGVQCESCHGPGEKHFKARFAAAQDAPEGEEKEYAAVPADEIIAHPPMATCLECHNEESPQFKGFCMKKRFEKVAHLDPRKKRSEADAAAMKCGCGDDEKCQCKKGDCGDLPKSK